MSFVRLVERREAWEGIYFVNRAGRQVTSARLATASACGRGQSLLSMYNSGTVYRFLLLLEVVRFNDRHSCGLA
jgi:hypothetical protein